MEPAGITDLLLLCARFEALQLEPEEKEAIFSEIRLALMEVFRVLTVVLAANPKWQTWTADSKNPGYLIRSFHGLEVRVPWNLLKDFPPDPVLQEIAALVSQVRSGIDTSLCISGSSALYSGIHPVGDIDFCEYVSRRGPEAGERSFARTVRKASSLANEHLVCIRLRILGGSQPSDRSRPWTVAPGEDERFLRAATEALAGKCDFVGRTEAEGVLEITNLVLFLESDPEEGSGRLSFPPQEAPITEEGGWVPRRLAEPLTLGRYIQWLRQDVSAQLSPEKPEASLAKAAKRALSLTRILFLDELGDRLLEIMHEQDLVRSSAIRARLELRRKIRRMQADPAVAVFEAPLLQTLRGIIDSLKDAAPACPATGPNDSWCDAVESYVKRLSEGDEKARREILSILTTIPGLH